MDEWGKSPTIQLQQLLESHSYHYKTIKAVIISAIAIYMLKVVS